MVTRIRYRKQLESWFSDMFYLSANDYVKIMIDYDFTVYFYNNSNRIAEIPCKSLKSAKTVARRELIKYGVKLGHEAKGKRK